LKQGEMHHGLRGDERPCPEFPVVGQSQEAQKLNELAYL